ncbi:MAG: hypothetical protein HYX60_00785 [Legionella longbeachae]|nr:hypothetical protein [Legionella longbeachae]
MPQNIKILFISLLVVVSTKIANATPWFTGPIFAGSGHTIPRGHTNFEIYGIDVLSNGKYNNSGNVINTPLFKSILINPLLTHGFTDWMDIQVSVPYAYNATRGMSYNHVADNSLGAGFQLIEQKKHKLLPDLRLFIQEIFPTGKFEQLSPVLLGTDSTGLGSYRTNITLNFQYLAEVFNSHYLRTRLIYSRLYSTPVNVTGLSSFGGTLNTRGKIDPGTESDIDLAFEFTLTQNWVAVMEGYITQGGANNFSGILNTVNDGDTPSFRGNFYETGLAPAIEYNITSNVGIIGGVWFPVKGQNTSHFISYVVALNAFW